MRRNPNTACDSNYGNDTCAVPDLTAENLESEKLHIINELKKNSLNREEIEKLTKDQSNSNDWMRIRRIMLTSSILEKFVKERPNFQI